MTRDVSLTSQAWCDLVFEGKNKYYGAYELRRESSNRHLNAILIVTAAIVSILFAVKLYGKINAAGDTSTGKIDTPVKMTLIDLSVPKPENQIVTEKPQEVVKVKSAIKYMTITIDPNVTDGDEPETMDAINKSTAIISSFNHDGDDNDPNAKNPNDVDHPSPPAPIVTTCVESPVIFAEVMPEPPGGMNELMRYLAENLKYPVVDMENGVHGRVQIRFIVGIDGSISDIQVVRSLSPTCDKEAIRVIKGMKKWIPGRQNGKAVPVYFSLPVKFALET